jgi:muramoyltetrapeptide carboxypeptidase
VLWASGCSVGGPRELAVSPPVRVRGLRAGDTIAVVAPGHPLMPDRVEQACRRLQRLGFRTKIVGDVYVRRGYLAGSDAARAEAILDAYRDPEVDAIFCGTGGYGTTRLLERIDFDVIREHPKILLGYSDVTALHLAIQKEAGQITFHGPNLMWGLGSLDRNLTPFASAHLWRLLCADPALAARCEEGTRQDAPSPAIDRRGSSPPGSGLLVYDLALCEPDTPRPKALRPGRGRGRLTGGNLSLVAALMGTPWEIETQGRVVFFEDVGEAPYRIDRFLCQLKQAGKLDGVAGVILGRWHECDAEEPDKSLTLDEVFADYFENAPYPVVMDFPVGHVRDNATLPVGAWVELDADALTLSVLEPVVQ